MDGKEPRALTHESTAAAVVMGRDGSADFQLPLSTISRQHARITYVDKTYLIEDLNSTHGTFVNGKKIEAKTVLHNGDVIEMTKAKVTAAIEEEAGPTRDPNEGTQALAARAVQGILGQLAQERGDGPFFRIIAGPDEGARHALVGTNTEWTFGRSKDCEFMLNDPNVSRRHAIVKKDWNGYLIQDLGSKNGVLINDRLIQKQRRLRDRDEVTIGPVKLLFIDPDAALLAALKDVPGFEDEQAEEADATAPPVGGGSQAHGGGGVPLGGPGGESGESLGAPQSALPSPVVGPPADPEPDFSGIDPALIEPPKKGRLPLEWVVIPFVALAVVGIVALIFALLA